MKLRETVTLDLIGEHIALVTIDRPSAHNAINKETAAGIAEAVDRIEVNKAIRAAIITGAGGRAFCSGADLKETAAGGMSALFIDGKGFAGFVDAPRTKPWIAAVDGYALAGGCEIALACEMIVSSSVSQFGLPEVRRGLIAGAGGCYRLARLMPRNLAIELVLTGSTIDAAHARECGLVNHVTEPGNVLARATALAESIAQNAPLAVEASLSLIRGYTDETDSALGIASRNHLAELAGTADYVEGVAAFIEKRQPVWVGE